MNKTEGYFIHEYDEISAIKNSNPREFAKRRAKLQEELELFTAGRKRYLEYQWERLAEVAHIVSRASLLYIRKDYSWRKELLEYCTVGPCIWAEGGHIYFAYTTADIIHGPSRERLKRRSVFTKDWVQTNITPLKNSFRRLKNQGEVNMCSTSGYKVELTDVGTKKVKIMKTIWEMTGADLHEAKEKVDNAPVILTIKDTLEDALLLKSRLEEYGAKVAVWCC